MMTTPSPTAHLRAALTALRSIKGGDHRDRELAILIDLGRNIRTARGYAEGELMGIYEAAHKLARDLDRPLLHIEVVYGLWTLSAGRRLWREAARLALEFATLSRPLQGESQFEIEAFRLHGAADAFMGNFAGARARFERALALYDPTRHGARFGFDPGSVVAAYLAWTQWHLGDSESARRSAQRALEISEHVGHPRSVAMVLTWLMFHAMCEEDVDAIECYNARLQIVCSERECRYWQPFGAACAEWAAFERDGDPRRLERLLAHAAAFEEVYLISPLLVSAARICMTLNLREQGLEIVGRAIDFIEAHDERVWEAEALRVKAELLQLGPGRDSDGAEELLGRALHIAQGQGAKALEVRVRCSMDTFYARRADQGDRRRA